MRPGTWRAWMAAACACSGCAHESTSDYGVAGGFAAVAGALQVGQIVAQENAKRSCNPQTCAGCCDIAGQCVGGTADQACGTGGAVCRDCVVDNHQACGEGVCAARSGPNVSQYAAGAPLLNGISTAFGSCRQFLSVCFSGTHSICAIDAAGCPVCSCTHDNRFDWAIAP